MNRTITLISSTAESPTGLLETRPIEVDDAEALARLFFTAYDDGSISSQDQALQKIQSVFEGKYGDFYPEASPIIIDGNGRAIAAALCLYNRKDHVAPADIATIYELVTAASRRREGLAEQLIRISLNTMHRAGIEEVTVRIAESNAAALAFYLALGFRRWQNPDENSSIYP